LGFLADRCAHERAEHGVIDADEHVILVDAEDREIGTAPKLAAHRDGTLHRAISVQISDRHGRLLLQKRHVGKYHSGGLWTNTCCSHPRPGETAEAAAARRLREEMGITASLRPLFTTTYRADVGNGLTEHELVHVFGGMFDGAVLANPNEADGFEWTSVAALRDAIARQSDRYTPWFKIYLKDFQNEMTQVG
jgi:isopentenyl-diphosphate delta-isomerase